MAGLGSRGAAQIFLLSLIGCAPSQADLDWRTICASAPYGLGQSYSPAEQRAMSRLGLWAKSVKLVNADCHER